MKNFFSRKWWTYAKLTEESGSRHPNGSEEATEVLLPVKDSPTKFEDGAITRRFSRRGGLTAIEIETDIQQVKDFVVMQNMKQMSLI